MRREETTEMKATRISLALVLMLIAASLLAPAGCGGNPEAESKVDQAIELIGSSQPLLEDLLGLDKRLNDLGTRFTDVDDTLAEGRSLVEMALLDIAELETRYVQAREMLQEVANMQDAGDYAEYARLALKAVDIELEAMALNRELLTTFSDTMDVLPYAQSQEQLSYYTEEIERLTGEISDLLQQGAEAAQAADLYYEEHGL